MAHLDRGSVTDYVGVAEKSRMTIEQLDGIYRKAGEIVNEVSLPFRDSMRLFEAFGWDDFKTVLEYMERGRQAILDDLKSGRLKKP